MNMAKKADSRLATRFATMASATALMVGIGATSANADVITASCTDGDPAGQCSLLIPPAGTSGTTLSLINIGTSGTITDIDVFVDLDHTWTGDLEIRLIAPDASSVLLFNQWGGSGDDITQVWFDDEAATGINSVNPPYGPGSYQPDPGFLSSFDGLALSGTWTLRIDDQFGGDLGVLTSWAIRATYRPTEIPAPAPLMLMAVGLPAMAFFRRRKARRQ